LALLCPALLVIGLLVGFPLLALAGLGIFAFAQAVRRADAPAESFVLLVVALGCAILFGTELIYIRDVFSSRMNTIFKFYYQVWLLWGTMAAYAVWWSGRWVVGAGAGAGQQGRSTMGSRVAAGAVLAMVVVLLIGGMVYPAINVRNLIEHGTQVGLHGKTPRAASAAGEAALQWLRENVERGSVVLEAVGGAYNGEGFGGVAASTGIPTVLGWPGHERQWRGGHEAAKEEIGPREMAVETIYSTGDAQTALDLLQKYEVDYVYVGALERQKYGASIDKFAAIGAVVFQQDEVTIYAVGGG
jgi:YYY domain-containing protein